ncbi:hypothetical protein IQ264_21520 [Phormidium sp. LEGE 05292]|uniref:hypothetical protein n=1 Tax=[Phormidium] sp. LEGE 05292 TaxID=767427 RepID=UPI00187FB089|nr:hypothetical protein [Phormidium sp. LEGE 05292]MBE9228006.1 hypothetical protein [Phormidium sp. LEGE 05292]
MKEFGLTLEWAIVMFSYEYHLTLEDIRYETDSAQKIFKKDWLSQFTDSINNFLQSQVQDSNCLPSQAQIVYYPDRQLRIFTDFTELKNQVEKLLSNLESPKIPKLVLLNLSLFVIYHPLGVEEDEQYAKLKLSEKFRSRIVQTLESYAETLQVEKYLVTTFKSSYKILMNDLQEPQFPLNLIFGGLIGAVVVAVAAAVAMPLVIAVLAPLLAPGLSGAAAISAVLAALGGGAIAAGGLGMAGGVAVIVGGGAILGVGAGTGIGALFTQSPELVIPEAAKFLVAFKDIILAQKNVPPAQIVKEAKELLQKLRDSIRSYEDREFELNINSQANQKERDNIKKVLSYLNKAIEIAEQLLSEFLRRKNFCK